MTSVLVTYKFMLMCNIIDISLVMISYIDVLPHCIGMDKTNDQTGPSNNMFYNEGISMCRN